MRRRRGTRPNGPRVECPNLGDRGLQPVATEVGTRVGIAEGASQPDVGERVGVVESPVTEPTGTVVAQRVVVRRVVLQDISIDRRREIVQRLGMQTLGAR